MMEVLLFNCLFFNEIDVLLFDLQIYPYLYFVHLNEALSEAKFVELQSIMAHFEKLINLL